MTARGGHDRGRNRDRHQPRDRDRDRGPERETGLGGDQVEGRHAVLELLRTKRRRVRELWVATGRDDATLDEIVDLAYEAGARVHEVPPARVDLMAKSEVPQGVVARAAAVRPADIDELLGAPDAFLVALDGVTDPGNLGAVLRTAAAAGATGVVLPRHRAARLSPTAVKAAAGAVEHLAIAQAAGIPALLDRAHRNGVWSVGLDASGDTELFGLPVADRPLVLVLGAEGTGLSRLARDRCEIVARIPMFGPVESLNVSAAAALACFEVARSRLR
jgi:23S rRNA (guanosine2251-2'-O)-methyltransferase